jgi:hypothetical protein
MWDTNRRLCVISFSRAAESPASAAKKYFFSSSADKGGGKLCVGAIPKMNRKIPESSEKSSASIVRVISF